jgi:hypothetical protein
MTERIISSTEVELYLRVAWRVCAQEKCEYFFCEKSDGKPECGLVWDYYVYDDFPMKGMHAPVQTKCPHREKHRPFQPKEVLSKAICLRCLKEYFKEELHRLYYGDDHPPWKQEHFDSGWERGHVHCPGFDAILKEKQDTMTDTCEPPPEWCRYALEHVMEKQ